jgi:hypothetical protein
MRYSCENIKFFLAHDELDPVDELEFLSHLESCKSCRESAMLEPELEEILAVSIPKASPLSFKKDILPEIYKIERGNAKQSRIEKITMPVMALLSFIPAVLAVLFWKDIKSLPDSLNLAGIYDKLATFISGIDLPEINLAQINAFIAEAPLLTITLISITAIIWAFSIMEAQKALK